MKDIQYAYGVARVRANERKMLNGKDIDDIISSKSFTEAISILVQKGYAKEGDSVEAMLKRQSVELYSLLSDCVPEKRTLDTLFVLNDFFNVKVIVKCAVADENPQGYFKFPSTVDCPIFGEKVSEKSFSLLNDKYHSIAEKAYNAALLRQNGKYADAIIDRAAIDMLCTFSKSKHLLGQISEFQADTANIKIAFRCAETNQEAEFIEESIGKCSKLDRAKLVSTAVDGVDSLLKYLLTTVYKEGVKIYVEKPSAFEKWSDDKLIELTSRSVYTSFGSEPIVSYYYRKSLEIKTVRIVLNAIKSNVDRNIIKEKVREFYA